MLRRREALALSALSALAAARTDAAQQQPARVERAYVPGRFGQVHIRRAGSGGTPLVAIHLVPNSGQVFTRFLALMATDRLAVAPDIPGYGMSDPAPDPQSIPDYAAAMLDALDALAIRQSDLLGYHTGAAIALHLAAMAPERVRRLLLVAVPVFSPAEQASLGALTPIPFDEDGGWAKAEWQRSWQWRGPGQDRDSVLRGFAEKMRPGARERGASAIAAYDTGAALVAARQPLMIVRPKDDLWEATGRALALRPDVPAMSLPQYGHGLFDVAPQQMADMARGFLA